MAIGCPARHGYRAGYYGRNLVTRIGKLELRVPRDRSGEFSTALFERYARSEKALVAALAEMYVQGVSTRQVKAITEELCDQSFSASAISAINKGLDENLLIAIGVNGEGHRQVLAVEMANRESESSRRSSRMPTRASGKRSKRL